ncbi:alpha/beta hydrolase [Fodinicola acaciae]|uniref:alpha/beta hydrolase n=1 Tax=Fodinicola acaciae TaxID=2681555 RepID=UPI0013D7C092|nr:alpha/beta hydrolase [Fodinicola acaciae]
MRKILVAALSFVLLVGVFGGARALADSLSCQRKNVAVSLSAGGAENQRIAAWICAVGPVAGKPVQLLVPGYTYDHHYWDPAFQPDRYSWVRAATGAGYATVAIDRLGTGESSKPAVTAVTVPTHVWTVHQLIGDLRSGLLTGSKPKKVVLVGHSMGAAIAQTESGRYNDADAVVLTDWLHTPLWLGTPGVVVTSVPAVLEPRLVGAPPGYLTSIKGGHRSVFFSSADADPAMIAYDEAVKTYGTPTEEVTIVATILPTVTLPIRIPVFLATGENDSIFCGPATPCPDAATVKARERLFFGVPITTYVLPGAGHSANLHRNAPALFAAVNRWLAS